MAVIVRAAHFRIGLADPCIKIHCQRREQNVASQIMKYFKIQVQIPEHQIFGSMIEQAADDFFD